LELSGFFYCYGWVRGLAYVYFYGCVGELFFIVMAVYSFDIVFIFMVGKRTIFIVKVRKLFLLLWLDKGNIFIVMAV